MKQIIEYIGKKQTGLALKERTGENIHIGIFRGKERDLNKIEYTELGEADKYKKIVEIIRKVVFEASGKRHDFNSSIAHMRVISLVTYFVKEKKEKKRHNKKKEMGKG